MRHESAGATITWREAGKESLGWRAAFLGMTLLLVIALPIFLGAAAFVFPGIVAIPWVGIVGVPFYGGLVLRKAIQLMYPCVEEWFPPLMMRIGFYLAICTCVVACGVLPYLALSESDVLFLVGIPIAILVGGQCYVLLGMPEINRVQAGLEKIYF